MDSDLSQMILGFQKCKLQILNHDILKYALMVMSYSDVQEPLKMGETTIAEFGEVLDSKTRNCIKRSLAKVNKLQHFFMSKN